MQDDCVGQYVVGTAAPIGRVRGSTMVRDVVVMVIQSMVLITAVEGLVSVLSGIGVM